MINNNINVDSLLLAVLVICELRAGLSLKVTPTAGVPTGRTHYPPADC